VVIEPRITGMSVVGDILAEPQAVILYEREDEEAVREVMRDVTTEMAVQMAVSDPLLSSLVVIDNESQIEKWPGWLDIIVPSEIDSLTLHSSQTVVSLSPAFLRRRHSLDLSRLGRFYAMTPDAALAERISVDTIIHLENAA
jgi:hypothetical protein